MPPQYHSEICAIAHNAMEQLFAAGLIEAERMFEFDILCCTDVRRDEHFAAMRKDTALPELQASLPRPSAEAGKPAPSPKQHCAAQLI